MNEMQLADVLRTAVMLTALGLILCVVFWKVFKGGPPEEALAEPVEDLAKLSSDERYKLWREELREWTNYDGSSEGLQELLDRWDGIPHGKPTEPWGAGQTPCPPLPIGGGGTGAIPPIEELKESVDKYAREHSVDGKFSFEHAVMTARPIYPAVPRPFKVGQWVRRSSKKAYALKDGIHLWKIVKLQLNFVQVMTNCGELGVSYDDIEPAVPRNGEWWRWIRRDCPERAVYHRDPSSFEVRSTSFLLFHPATIGYEVACGCLVPANFGRGEEAKG